MAIFYRFRFWSNHGFIQLREVNRLEIVYDDCIKTTEHDIDITRIHNFCVKKNYEDQLQQGAKALALAELALKANEYKSETMKEISVFEDGNLQSARGEPKGKEDVIEREEEDSELRDLRIDVEVSQRHYERVQEIFVWDMHEGRHFERVLVQQLCRLAKEREEQIKGDETAIENSIVGQGT